MDHGDAARLEAQALFEHAACGLLQADADGRIRHVNRTFCRWVGFDEAELVGQRRFQDLLSVGGRIFHQTHIGPLLQMQGSVTEVKLDVIHRDGHALPMVLNAVRRQQASGEVHELALFVAEDRHKYERELLAARRRAEDLLAQQREIQQALTQSQSELSRQKQAAEDRAHVAEQMVGIVSHDLRNPLSAIQLSAYVLVRSDLGDVRRKTVDRIVNATQRAQRLIDDLLDFTVVKFGTGLSMKLAAIDLHQVVAGAADELRPAFPDRPIDHRRAGLGSCRADADRLTQAIGNLVGNAMTYGAVDRPVAITSVIEPASFTIAVHNEGAPIAAGTLAGLFEPMTRGLGATNSGRSVGLGLFIVRQIARGHGGEVSVSSTDTEGTTFVLRCPR